MAVKKTEQRIPSGFQATDLGQAVISSDNNTALVSYYSTPIVRGRKQSYVAFVLDTSLQSSINTYRWQVRSVDTNTQEGVWEYTPDVEGEMSLNVTLLDSSGTTRKVLSLTQTVVAPNADLENLIEQDEPVHPVAGDPVTSREVINDFLAHIHQIAPVGSAEVLNRLLFGVSYVEALDRSQSDRDRLLRDLRTAINGNQAASFFQQASTGGGICRIRPEILGMVVESGGSPLAPWEELPAGDAERLSAVTRIQTALAALAEEHRIDMYNILRFPKANLKAGKQIFDALRTRYFSGNTYTSILSNDTQAAQLINQFKTGPFAVTP